jgi:hypothetical protein
MRSSQPKSIGHRLLADHANLENLFGRLQDDIRSGDWTACQTTWTQFEQNLLNHIDAEEVYFLPWFEREYAAEAAALRQDHATIRYLLADMGVRLELHAVREANVARLIALLRAHTAKEERLLYRSAKCMPMAVQRALAYRLASGEAAPAPEQHVRRIQTS